MSHPSIEDIRKNFTYDAETGLLYAANRTRRTDLNGKPVGCQHGNGYLDVRLGKKLYYVHRICFAHYYGYWPEAVDHINGNRADNRICNLRDANKQLNGLNRGMDCDNSTGYKGVSYRKDTNNYMWQFVVEGKKYTKSGFATALDAYKHKVAFINALNSAASEFLKP